MGHESFMKFIMCGKDGRLYLHSIFREDEWLPPLLKTAMTAMVPSKLREICQKARNLTYSAILIHLFSV